jgi:hypothetical protein
MPFKDPEREKEYRKAYYQANKESHNARSRAYYQTHKRERRNQMQVWREQHPEYMRKYLNAYYIWKRYKITPQDRLALFESSDGLCALCYEAPATHIDHDHDTGRVRGALCQLCNQGLGHIERLGATSPAIEEYLRTDWRLDVAN